ncbi:MAG TPA: hypothetical protein VH274_06545 [Mycobacteriales bacterium]|jgi:hypothetical protein|nr:hypothetical protein [Mycobacteriales bacterium]
MRVYLAATLPLLQQWLSTGQAPPGPAQAVTPALREWYREGSEEEMEYVAQLAAVRAALDLLDADPDARRLRVVVAADVADLDVAPDERSGRSSVVVGAPVPVTLWASALVDDPDTESVVSAAVTALGAAAAGDDDALFALDEAASYELRWFAVQELPNLFSD